jgi:hypothetical protein
LIKYCLPGGASLLHSNAAAALGTPGLAVLVAVFSLAISPAAGQAPAQRPAPARAQAPAAKAQAYAPPKTSDGQPNLMGVWKVWNLAKYDVEAHSAKPGVPAGLGVVVDPPDGKIPYTAAGLEKRKRNYEGTKTNDPVKNLDETAKCYNAGAPRLTYFGWPFEIIQGPKYVAIIYEWMHQRRFVYFDPKGRMQGVDFWMGDSRGHWEGNTLVVDVTNFNDLTWFDMAGNHHSEAMHLTEKYIPTGPDTLQYEVTIDDPKTFTRPWKMAMTAQRQKDIGLLEYECHALLEESGVPLTWDRSGLGR